MHAAHFARARLLLVGSLLLTGCGRLAFDPLTTTDATPTTNQDEYLIDYDGGLMHYLRRDAGVDIVSMEPYDPMDHRFWRIEHVVATNEVTFSTSSDRMSWFERYRLVATVPVTALEVEIGAGSYQGGSPSPGPGAVRQLQLCLP